MKKPFILLLLLFISSSLSAQSTEEILNNFDGEFDQYSKIIDDSFISLTFGLGLSAVPIVLYPVSVYADLTKKQRSDMQISYQVFASVSSIIWISSIIVNQTYKHKSSKLLDNKYNYEKIISKNLGNDEILEYGSVE